MPMPVANDLTSTSLWTSLGIALVALFLALRQWYESRARDPELSSEDRSHFKRQDVRRCAGIAVILILAVGLSIGTRLDPKIEGRANPGFIGIWIAELALVIVLLVLAAMDSLATFAYARRHRRSLARERGFVVRELVRRHDDSPPEPPAGDHD
jgi:hypothetical protein